MKKNLLVLATLFAVLGTVSSCKKDNNNNQNQPANNPPQPTLPTDADGGFAHVLSVSYTTVGGSFGIPTIVNKLELGVASAWLGQPNAFEDAGVVKCQDSVLTKAANNAYVFQPKSLDGIQKSNATRWDVQGSGSLTGFVYTHNANFPSVDSIANGMDVNTGSAFTLEAKGSVTNSDSVIFMVIGPSGFVLKTKGPNVKTCDFTASEMATVGKGDNSGLLQIAPYRLLGNTINGKKYYFIKETCVSKFVNLK